jgi:hypothetical protein
VCICIDCRVLQHSVGGMRSNNDGASSLSTLSRSLRSHPLPTTTLPIPNHHWSANHDLVITNHTINHTNNHTNIHIQRLLAQGTIPMPTMMQQQHIIAVMATSKSTTVECSTLRLLKVTHQVIQQVVARSTCHCVGSWLRSRATVCGCC